MRSKHITKILDETAFKDLKAEQLGEINSHAANCAQCKSAFESARLSDALLKNFAPSEVFEPTPFFETRVLAALREKQLMSKPIAAFWRWWQASSAVVFLMLLSIGFLVVLTALAPQNAAENQEQATALNDYSTEQVFFRAEDARDELTAGQALQIIYETQNSY